MRLVGLSVSDSTKTICDVPCSLSGGIRHRSMFKIKIVPFRWPLSDDPSSSHHHPNCPGPSCQDSRLQTSGNQITLLLFTSFHIDLLLKFAGCQQRRVTPQGPKSRTMASLIAASKLPPLPSRHSQP